MPPALNLLVFREGGVRVDGAATKVALCRDIASFRDRPAESTLLPALLRAGELESAAVDAGYPARIFQSVTDLLAHALLGGRVPSSDWQDLLSLLQTAPVPQTLSISTAEGFAYYALHPLAYSDVIARLHLVTGSSAVVAGIRSIGTTLSAITAAALRTNGIAADRITVRPTGHPYNRYTELTPEEAARVQAGISAGSIFLVVDEGPGLSGSSFLSVGEALVRMGVSPERIVFIGSHEPQIEHLRAERAAQRWRQFRSVAVDSGPRLPAGAQIFVGGGEWRRGMYPTEAEWPAAWISFERLKYLSQASAPTRLWKFLGLGHYGSRVLEREERVAAGGFGPSPQTDEHGFASYPLIPGRPMQASDLSAGVLARLAAYCAFRAREFAVDEATMEPLQQMAQHNSQELGLEAPAKLSLEKPVIADGRMQPHEWLLTDQGQMLKTDSGSHGDDHFFPGPTDIAWDLAGAIVEWKMDAGQRKTFLEMYEWAGGDCAQSRIAGFIHAYSVFRCAYCLMAANALHGSAEQERLERAAAGYAAAIMNIAANVPSHLTAG